LPRRHLTAQGVESLVLNKHGGGLYQRIQGMMAAQVARVVAELSHGSHVSPRRGSGGAKGRGEEGKHVGWGRRT